MTQTGSKRNKEAEKYLIARGWVRSNEVVSDLIEGGFIAEDELSRPERFAQAAKTWTNSSYPFKYAAGWTTSSWEAVTGEFLEHDMSAIADIFWALVLLAKEEGVEL